MDNEMGKTVYLGLHLNNKLDQTDNTNTPYHAVDHLDMPHLSG